MSTYRKIHGRSIQAVTTDPTGDVAEGQVWYNTSSDTFKSVIASKAFVSSTPYPTAIFGNMGAGTQTAALSFGGTADPSTPSSPLVLTLEYNGSGWTTGGDMSQKRRNGFGFGTQTAALGSTGYTYPYTNKTEHYNGTSWTNGGNYPVSYELAGGCGTQTAGLACGGGPAGTDASFPGLSNEYDGSSWTASPGGLNTGRAFVSTVGTQTAGLAAGGANAPGATGATNCEEYNGSTWTTVNSLNTARARTSFGSGIQTAAISYGTPGSLESYDGTNWTNEPATMGNARDTGASAGTATASLAACGSPGAFTSHVEEYNVSANVLTAAAWSSGGSLGTGRYQSNGQNVGTKDAGLIVGGQGSYPPSNPAVTISNVEEYDGSSWSEVTNLPTTRAMVGTVGTQTAAFLFGGYGKPGGGPNPAPSSPNFDTTFNYDGSSWTSETAMPAAVAYLTGAGTQTAALSIGGYNALTACNEYDGSSWTGGGAMTTGRHNGSAFGIQTAAVIAGGAPAPAGTTTDVESYDGSSWTSAATLILAKEQGGTAGTQTDGLITLGNQPNPTNSAGYNGTAWFTQPSTSTARYGGANGGTNVNSAYYAGGGGGPPTRQVTEEFTGSTASLNKKNISTS
jgi:hypothetical protein